MNRTWLQGKLFASVVVSAVLLSGCGFKAPPVAPETVVPEAINDLRYTINEEGTHFTWSYPVKSIAGDKIQEIDGFELYQAAMSVEEICNNCPIPFNEPIELDGGSVYDGEQRKKGSYSIASFENGNKYFFTLRSKTSWWASSKNSNIISFTYFTPPSAVTDLVAEPRDNEIRVAWQGTNTLSDGSDAPADFLYQVQRSSEDKRYVNIGTPQEQTSFVDRRVARDSDYSYRIQTMMLYGEDLVQGLVSSEVTSRPADLQAPPTPKALRVVRLEDGLKLIWDRVEVPDLAGYRIYRKKRGGNVELITEVDVNTSTYTDPVSGYYIYSVSAIDTADPVNESGRSIEVGPR